MATWRVGPSSVGKTRVSTPSNTKVIAVCQITLLEGVWNLPWIALTGRDWVSSLYFFLRSTFGFFSIRETLHDDSVMGRLNCINTWLMPCILVYQKIPGSSNFFFRCFPADSKSLIGILHMDSRKDGSWRVSCVTKWCSSKRCDSGVSRCITERSTILCVSIHIDEKFNTFLTSPAEGQRRDKSQGCTRRPRSNRTSSSPWRIDC